MKQFIILSTVIFLFPGNTGFTQEVPDLITDRPTQAESASIIPTRSFQIETGINPLRIGAKTHVTEEKGIIPATAFIGKIVIPGTGKADFNPDGITHGFRFACAYTLSSRFSLGYNLGMSWDGDHPETIFIYSLVVDMFLIDLLDYFMEVYGYKQEKAPNDFRADSGLTYLLLPTLKHNTSGSIGLNEVAPEGFIIFGLSWRIPN